MRPREGDFVKNKNKKRGMIMSENIELELNEEVLSWLPADGSKGFPLIDKEVLVLDDSDGLNIAILTSDCDWADAFTESIIDGVVWWCEMAQGPSAPAYEMEDDSSSPCKQDSGEVQS